MQDFHEKKEAFWNQQQISTKVCFYAKSKTVCFFPSFSQSNINISRKTLFDLSEKGILNQAFKPFKTLTVSLQKVYKEMSITF